MSIALLEAGGPNTEPSLRSSHDRFENLVKNAAVLDRGYVTTPQKELGGRQIPYARGKGLGGSTVNNLMLFDYGCEGDMDEWARSVGDDEWRWENAKRRIEQVGENCS